MTTTTRTRRLYTAGAAIGGSATVATLLALIWTGDWRWLWTAIVLFLVTAAIGGTLDRTPKGDQR